MDDRDEADGEMMLFSLIESMKAKNVKRLSSKGFIEKMRRYP